MRILPLENIDAELIVRWNNKKTADFLNQWAGRGYEYPITVKQITDRIQAQHLSDFKLYKIIVDDKMIGTIELMSIDHTAKTAAIGHFLLQPEYTGKGYGTKALINFIAEVFICFHFNKIRLSVFDFNKSAFQCYTKAGFKVVSKVTRPNGWVAILMEISNPIK